jgi:hypothetical protein
MCLTRAILGGLVVGEVYLSPGGYDMWRHVLTWLGISAKLGQRGEAGYGRGGFYREAHRQADSPSARLLVLLVLMVLLHLLRR